MKSFKQFLQEGINDKGIFKAIFLGGTPGSGKSYVSTRISDGQIDARVVNTDKFLEFISSKRNIDIGPGFDKEAKEFAKLFKDTKNSTSAQLTGFINGMLPMVIDSTSANTNNGLMRKNKNRGYQKLIVWNDAISYYVVDV